MDDSRARVILRDNGFEQDELTRCSSYANEVWAGQEYVIRIDSIHHHGRLRNEIEIVPRLPNEVRAPEMLTHGDDWIISRRVEGIELARAWRSMTTMQRRAAIEQLAGMMRALHTVPAASGSKPGGPDRPDAGIAEGITRLREAQTNEWLDASLADEAIETIERGATAIDDTPTTLIHDDIHFENVMWDGARVTALLDFEKACLAPPDHELEWLSHVCMYPARHASDDHDELVEAETWQPIIGWLHQDYPELFAHPRLLDRLILFRMLEMTIDVRYEHRRGQFFGPLDQIKRLVNGTSDLHHFFA